MGLGTGLDLGLELGLVVGLELVVGSGFRLGFGLRLRLGLGLVVKGRIGTGSGLGPRRLHGSQRCTFYVSTGLFIGRRATQLLS